MKNHLTYVALLFFFLTSSLVVAQDEKKSDEKNDPNIEMNIEITLTIMNKMFEKAGLDTGQSKKIDEILTKYTRDLVLLRREEQGFLSKEQKQTFGKALKMAQRAKLTGPEAEDYALRKLGLEDDVLKKFKELKAKIKAKNDKMNGELAAVLTDEQRAKVPLFKKMAKGTEVKSKPATGSKKADPAGAEGN